MTNTTNYDLILVEGSDKVNPLTQVNPNFETIDAEMKKNKDAGVSTATELLTGSIHGLQRANADASMFRFTATSNYTAGDTFTVDGIQVTALTPTGEALGNGAYIIGSEVLCCLKGTLLTMFLSGGTVTTADNALKLGGQEPEYYGTAADVTQAQQTATAAGVLANSVQTQVTELANSTPLLVDYSTWDEICEGVAIPSGTTVSFSRSLDNYRFIGVEVKFVEGSKSYTKPPVIVPISYAKNFDNQNVHMEFGGQTTSAGGNWSGYVRITEVTDNNAFVHGSVGSYTQCRFRILAH